MRPWIFLLVVGVMTGACSVQAPSSDQPPAVTASLAPAPTPTRTSEPAPTAGAFDTSLVAGLRTETDVPFTGAVPCGATECAVPLDVLAPEDGEGFPTIVLLPGGPGRFTERRYMEGLAAALAQRGAVVFLAAYRSSVTGNPESDGLVDVRCAVRYARSAASDYGGDPGRVLLVGHSYGSTLALQAAIDGDAETPACLADESAAADAVVGLAAFRVSVANPPETAPSLLLVSGSDDVAAADGESTAASLRDAGFQAEYVEVEGIDHLGIVDPDLSPSVLDLIFEASAR